MSTTALIITADNGTIYVHSDGYESMLGVTLNKINEKPIGLVGDILEHLKEDGYSCEIVPNDVQADYTYSMTYGSPVHCANS